MHPSENQSIILFNKEIDTPRWFQNYGHSYNFSNKKHPSFKIPEILKPFIDYVNICEEDYTYNGILVNWYENGENYIGPHSDNEKELNFGAPIYCFSLGAERKFVVKNKNKNINEKYEYILKNNSLLIMGGECQKYYKHSLPKTKKIKNSRISITIRSFR